MAKPRSAVSDYAVYLVVRLVVCLLQAMSWRLASGFAVGLAWLAYRVDRRHREAAMDNLRHAFPESSDAENDARVRAVYRHFCMLLVEITHLPRYLHPCNWREYVHFRDGSLLVDAILSGRPLLMVTAHFGNWEMGGYVTGLLGLRSYAIARPLDNPYLDNFLRRFRERTGQKLLAKKGDFNEMMGILARNGILATLGDQDAGQRGLFVDFFGRPASTHKAVALLSLEHKVPMLVIGVRKVGEPMRYEVMIEDVILPEEYEGKPDAVRSMTQRFTSAIERLVRTAPEQYFWLHRRWKHQPPKSKKKAA